MFTTLLVCTSKIKLLRATYFRTRIFAKNDHRERSIIIAISVLDAPVYAIVLIYLAELVAVFFWTRFLNATSVFNAI